MWWRRQCKIPSARSTECMPSTMTLLQTLWRMSWGLELLLHLLSYLQQERESYYRCSHSPLAHKAKSLSTLIQTEGYSASLYYIKVCLKYHEFKMADKSLFEGELLGSVRQSFDKSVCSISHLLYSWVMGKLQVGQVMSVSIISFMADHTVTKIYIYIKLHVLFCLLSLLLLPNS